MGCDSRLEGNSNCNRGYQKGIWERLGPIAEVYEAQRFDLRFFRRFSADLSITKSASFFPPLIAATSQRGLAPRPAQVSPEGLRYLGGTFLPLNGLPPPRTTFAPRTTAIALIVSNCF